MMRINKTSFFWGALLIVAGALALFEQLGYTRQYSAQIWIGVFIVISLLGFVFYALSGWKVWGWLFPAGIFGGLAITGTLANAGIDNPAVGSPLFFGLTLPFAAAYFIDRPRHWWALITGGMLLFLALTTLLVETVGDEWIGAMFLFMIAAVFLTVYLTNRSRTWALIVAYVFAVLGIAPLMSTGGRNAAFFGPIFLLAVALPFFVMYFRPENHWWAIIPAGTLTTAALIAAVAISGLVRFETNTGYGNALMMGGLAVTFAVVWLRHAKSWAGIVAIVLAALAVASIFFANYAQFFWPVAIVAVGIYLFVSALRPKVA